METIKPELLKDSNNPPASKAMSENQRRGSRIISNIFNNVKNIIQNNASKYVYSSDKPMFNVPLENAIYSFLGEKYGVSWKSKTYGDNNTYLVSEKITETKKSIKNIMDQYGYNAPNEWLLNATFEYLSLNDPYLHESKQFNIKEFVKEHLASQIKREEISLQNELLDSNREVVEKAKEKAQNETKTKLFNLSEAKAKGWDVEKINWDKAGKETLLDLYGNTTNLDAVIIGIESGLSYNDLTPSTYGTFVVLPWEHDGKTLVKVKGMTHVFEGQWGDDPPNFPKSSDHTADSMFIEYANKDKGINVFTAYNEIQSAINAVKNNILGNPKRNNQDIIKEYLPSFDPSPRDENSMKTPSMLDKLRSPECEEDQGIKI